MDCCINIIATNAGGVPYITSTNTTIGTETVDIALGFRRIQPIGYLTIAIDEVIPAATTVTAAELLSVNTILVFNDRKRGLLVLMSRTTV